MVLVLVRINFGDLSSMFHPLSDRDGYAKANLGGSSPPNLTHRPTRGPALAEGVVPRLDYVYCGTGVETWATLAA
jgi:hypothetical protein